MAVVSPLVREKRKLRLHVFEEKPALKGTNLGRFIVERIRRRPIWRDPAALGELHQRKLSLTTRTVYAAGMLRMEKTFTTSNTSDARTVMEPNPITGSTVS
jgi:hypothetical protein